MSLTVVVADDDTDIRELVVITARRAGLDVVAAVPDGDAALAAIREHRPDLAILDVSMPGHSGFDICRAVRADTTLDETRLLLLSASVDEKAQAVGRDAGADHFLPKPFSPRALVEWLAVGKEPR
jgi:DNA-binding response OmpR family regulator